MHRITDLAALIARHAPEDGFQETALASVTLIRSAAVTTPTPTVYAPSLCMVAQGAKEAQLGRSRFYYDPGSFLLAGVDLPVVGAVTQASADAPYLCLVLHLDAARVAEMVAEHPIADPQGDRPIPGLILGETTAEMIDAACRLLALLDAPEDRDALAPLLEREMLWRLLRSPAGQLLRQMAGGPQSDKLNRALQWLRHHYAEPVSIETLAEVAGMSPSALHQHFRTVTGLSPLRYRTQLRVQEARRLMIARGLDAATAGFQVGYGSPSQFSREYARTMGLPPSRDVERLRASTDYLVA